MKSLIYAGASLLAIGAASPVLAQATVPPACVGATGNASDVIQINRQQTATILQTGDDNTSTVAQTNRRQNDATVTQSGNGNNGVATIDQAKFPRNETATITQGTP